MSRTLDEYHKSRPELLAEPTATSLRDNRTRTKGTVWGLPNLSKSMYVARLRYIQSIHESPQHRNPDGLVRNFVPILVRLRTAWLGREELSKLRADPFYYYLVARTKYYDQVVNDGRF